MAGAPQNPAAFDYDLSKDIYMAKIKKCFDNDSTHSESTIQRTIKILNDQVKSHLHKYYEVSFAFGREILLEKAKTSDDLPVQVLTYEDVFDVFIKFHIGNNHIGGSQHLRDKEKELNCCYNYPTVCLSLIVKSCNVCGDLSRLRNLPKSSIKISSVFITIMVQKRLPKVADFKYILIYVDKATDFVLLRPLRQKSDIEVSMEIFKIMMSFGPPQKLCLHGYNNEFNIRIGIILRQVCPMFSFSIKHKSANFDPSAYIVNKLQEWMSKNARMSWEIGCSVVQKELNMKQKHKVKVHTEENKGTSPYELFYGKSAESKTDEGNVIIVDNAKDNLNNGVVELRIPSPDNYNPDLLNQFEDSENSQEQDFPSVSGEADTEAVKIINKAKGVPSVTKEADIETVKIIDESNTDKKHLKKEESTEKTGKSVKVIKHRKNSTKICKGMITNLFCLRQKPVKTPIPLDMECEIDKPKNKDKSPVLKKRKSLRIAKRAKSPQETQNEDEDDGMIAEHAVDEDLIYNPDDVGLDDAIDPLGVDLDA